MIKNKNLSLILLMLIVLPAFVSAGFFGDLFNQITGNAVDLTNIDGGGGGSSGVVIDDEITMRTGDTYLEPTTGKLLTVNGIYSNSVGVSVDGIEAIVPEDRMEFVNGLSITVVNIGYNSNVPEESVVILNVDEGIEVEVIQIEPPTFRINFISQYENPSAGTHLYKVVFNDLRVCEEGNPVDCEERTYEIEFHSDDWVIQSGLPDSVTLSPGENYGFETSIRTSNYGRSEFLIMAIFDGEIVASESAYIYLINSAGTEPNSYFRGEGFIFLKEDNVGLVLIDLYLRKHQDGALSGMFSMPGEVFLIDGLFVGKNFEAVLTNDGETYPFAGEIVSRYGADYLFGEMDTPEGIFEVMGIAQKSGLEFDENLREGKTNPISNLFGGKTTQTREIMEESLSDIAPSEVVEVSKVINKKTYVKSYKVKDKKFLGFIPMGSREVEVEVVVNGEIIRKKISEFGEQNFNGYKLSVGSLENRISLKSFKLEKI
jgi:hypothetical protein